MTYRLLPSTDWHRVAPLFEGQGSRLPADGSRILVAEDGAQIVGFLVLQWVPHAEPLWVDPHYRGAVYWPRLLSLAEGTLEGGSYFVFAPDDRIARFAELSGLEPLPWTVYRKEVN